MSAELAYLGNPELHFWLTRSMARILNVNLSEAMAEGRLSANGYAEMVNQCRQCPYVEACQKWLATCGVNAEQAPEHCAHKPVLDALL